MSLTMPIQFSRSIYRLFCRNPFENLPSTLFLNRSNAQDTLNRRYCRGTTDLSMELNQDEKEVVSDLNNTLRSFRLARDPHQVFVVQPYVKWGPKMNRSTTPELQMEEAIALVSTLPKWRVVASQVVPLKSFDKNTFFSTGHLDNVVQKTRSQQTISSVFINVKSLRLDQHLFLENILGVPVFDRHSVVINIFKHHAKTNVAKLQVSLAEIPYFWSRIQGINESEVFEVSNVGIGSGETFVEKRLRILRERERKIKDEIEKLRGTREMLRTKRRDREFPTVAVVGYTNAGKTSLIKALTSEDALIPEDKLFATLDVTLHAAKLPTNVKVLLIDTIGFISDIPSNLLEPFVVTLEDAIFADVIVHVQDASHPDRSAQEQTVMTTLKGLNLPQNLLDTIIHVGNKVDKLNGSQDLPDNLLPVSCKDGSGFERLVERLEAQVYENTGLRRLKIKVPNGGEEYTWLHKETAVFSVEEDRNNAQYLILGVAITHAKLEKFKYEFITKGSKRS